MKAQRVVLLLLLLQSAVLAGCAKFRDLPFEGLNQSVAERGQVAPAFVDAHAAPIPELDQPAVFVAGNQAEAWRFAQWVSSDPKAREFLQGVDYSKSWVVGIFKGRDGSFVAARKAEHLGSKVRVIVEIPQRPSAFLQLLYPYDVILVPRAALPDAKGTWEVYTTDGTLLAETTYPPSAPEDLKAVPFQHLAKSFIERSFSDTSDISTQPPTQPTILVSRNASETARLGQWTNDPDLLQRLRDVDYERFWVVAAFGGSGHPYLDITVREVQATSKLVRIMAELPEGRHEGRFVHPYHIFLVPRDALPDPAAKWVLYRQDVLLVTEPYP